MKIKSVLIATTITGLMSLAAASAYAKSEHANCGGLDGAKSESHKKGGHHGHRKGFKKVFAQLDLTDAQKTQMKTLRQQKRDGSLTRESFRSEVAGILSTEQNAKLDMLKAKRGERKQRRGMRGEQMKSLNLSTEQKTQMREARKELREAFRSQRKDAMSAKMKSILTDEQFAKFQTFQQR